MAKNLIKNVMTKPGKDSADIKKMIAQIESGYLKDRGTQFRKKKSFSPSTLVWGNGECARYWFYAFNGADFTDDADAYAVANMTNGTMSHERLQKAMKDSGFMIDDEVKVINSDPPIFGFADGIVEWNGEEIVAEIKTMREESFQYRRQSNKAPTYHIEQLVLYMKVLKKAKGVLIYESKNSHELHIIPIEVSDDYKAWVDGALEWMRTVHQAWKDEKLPQRTYRANSKVCKGCPVKEMCFADRKGDVRIKPMEHIGK